ncbi:hypothetical protein QBC46DRAFT_462929 [Diplogelasinospora grovesii]|uniref:LysM domain-containing protein n=1 Tax=Diplogelasinospora grovesii TaxID=303347 RepID=A0AAN6MUV8_9PEZI|nr:hypothetical protein QBC46DRAFT_462929 [Diplogelasinospora grovesii]
MFSSSTFVYFGVVIVFTIQVEAAIYVQSNASFPSNITSACSNALTADLACPEGVERLRQGLYYPESFLTSLCTTTCSSALAGYKLSVEGGCGGETYDSLTDLGDVPLYTIPQLLQYLYNYTCLADSSNGQYCNVVAANFIGVAANQSNLNSIEGGGTLNCTDCNLKQLQFLAGAAYYHDTGIVSVYSSLTSSCHVTDYPLTSSTLGFNTTATATTTGVTASPTCTGSTYTIQNGDTCESISKTQSVATMWLLIDNNLPAYCANFPTTGSLCIQHICTTYTVQANDTCTSISRAKGINYAQILAWNPQFDLTCSNINMTAGLEICISSPGPAYTPSTTSSAASVTASATTAVAVPSNAANGSTADCAQWYEAVPGDYCNLIIIRFGISLSDFLVLNPEVNDNCTNLYAYESYCMEPVGDMSNYPGAPGYVGTIPPWTTVPASSLPTATYIPALYVGPSITYANGTRTDCATYIDGSDYQDDLSNTTFSSQCDLALAVFSISFTDLTLFNPSLADASISNCSFAQNVSYCVRWSSAEPSTTGNVYPTALPTGVSITPVGSVQNCTQWTFADTGITCDDVLQDWNITISWLVSLNPEVGTDCSGFEERTYYCVNTTASVTTVSIPPSTSTATSAVIPPGPTQSGIPSNCDAYYVAQSGDTCATVEATYKITDAQFHAWNPAVSSDCTSGFWAGEAYCVGVATSTSPPTTTTTTTSTTVTPPGPTQSGIPATCDEYYLAQSGDTCASVEAKFGITDAQFHAWNPAVSSDCTSGFWANEAYCVGISGSTSVTTTTTGTASVTPPAPTQPGIPTNCDEYYVAQSGDSCSSVEAKYGITDAEFHAWNPAVSSDCTSGFWADEAYCVGVS